MIAKRPFAEVVSVHGPAVLRVCRAVLGPADADDAWSETFLAALRAYPELPADANVEAWLVTIAHRKAIDIVRKAARSAVPVADVPDGTVLGATNLVGTSLAGTSLPGSARAGSTQAGPGGQDVDLVRSLARLSERQRYAVAYHYLAGLPYAEVAAIIGGSADAARRAAADGIAKLRKAHAVQARDDQGNA